MQIINMDVSWLTASNSSSLADCVQLSIHPHRNLEKQVGESAEVPVLDDDLGDDLEFHLGDDLDHRHLGQFQL